MLDVNLIAPERTRPLRRSEYDRLVELGSFNDERLELLYGTLIEMTPQGTLHAECVRRLNRLLNRALGDEVIVQVQSPFAASNDSEPEPDIAVVPAGDYSKAHPSKALLIIEVADSSRQKDRELKSRLYAESDVTEYWLVDLIDKTVEVRSEPVGGHYARLITFRSGDVLRHASFPQLVLKVSDILPVKGE